MSLLATLAHLLMVSRLLSDPVYLGFLNIGITDRHSGRARSRVVGVLCLVRCLAAPLAPTYSVSVVLRPPAVTTKNVSGRCRCPLRGKHHRG